MTKGFLDWETMDNFPKEGGSALDGLDLNIDHHGDTTRITFSTSAISTGAILQKLADTSLPIKDISTEEPNLEDVFLSLTQDQ